MARPFLSRRASLLAPSTIFHLSQLAQRCNAINLAEGFPDFPAPHPFKDAAITAITSNFNQYRHVQALCDKVAEGFEIAQGVRVNPLTQVTLCCGQSEALVAAILAVVDEEDEVVLLDPSYDTYEAAVILAGGKAKHISMEPPQWTLDFKKLESAMSDRTKVIIVNSPHNPTGKVFSEEELSGIAELCRQFDCLAITDEVYEHIFFTGRKHKSLASFAGMQERTIVTSSISKTFSLTGWRIGWAIAPVVISSAISKIHGKLTDSAPAPFQEAAVAAFESTSEYYATLRKEYVRRRDFVCEMLEEAGFGVQFKPQGSFFVFAELPATSLLGDVEYVAELIRSAGVAIVPGCTFFHADDDRAHEGYRCRYVRVAFCKDMTTLSAARDAITRHSRSLEAIS